MHTSLFEQLAKHVEADIHTDALHRKIYSVDASIYEVEPLGIVLPKTTESLVTALRIAAEHQVPVVARGAATGITGGCLGSGLVIDTSKYLNRILEINLNEEYAVCQPGVVQDRLNEALAPHGYRLGPDTSTGNRATIGGMLANNSAGARSLHYGRMVDHVEEVDLALAGGERLFCAAVSDEEWAQKRLQSDREGTIYNEVFCILEQYRHEITTRFPHIPRRVSGYNLDELVKPQPLNLSKLVVGSEGTLGIATGIKVKIAKRPRFTALCIVHIADLFPAMQAIDDMLKHRPIALEMIDDRILEMGRQSPAVRDKLQWLTGAPQAVFVAEFEGGSTKKAEQKGRAFIDDMQGRRIGYALTMLSDPTTMGHVWKVRKAGLGLLLSKRTYSRAIAFIEDISIPPHNLAPFMEEFKGYLKSVHKDAGIYGHIGAGCMHIRPYIDLRSASERTLMQDIMLTVAGMVQKHGGAMSGEHGDGLVRSWMNEKMFGSELYKAFKELKRAFDPLNLMNPGKIVDAPPLLHNLKSAPSLPPMDTFLDFSAEGGLELSADLCNGNGQCRKGEKLMCPSFQATGDEYHTTRARAQSLRAVFNGRMPLKSFTSREMYDVLDLCLECKGCKTECPSQVDMAKMKAEFLYQYQQAHGYSLRHKLLAHATDAYRIFGRLPALFNAFTASWLGKQLLSLVGITPRRPLPALARERFSTWFARQTFPPRARQVALFNDTYTEFNRPEAGIAACQVLHALGYEVIPISGACCGRPLISKGLLAEAKAAATSLTHKLHAFAEQGIPTIYLEPSCHSAVTDDYRGLLSPHTDYRKLNVSFDAFIHSHLQDGRLPLAFKGENKQVMVHVHCHQKALAGTTPTMEVLKAVPGFTVKEIESGCCGLAGAFGYEKEHYDFSIKIGELHLLPAVREADASTLIVANGFSCTCQIHHGTQRTALHLAEALATHLA